MGRQPFRTRRGRAPAHAARAVPSRSLPGHSPSLENAAREDLPKLLITCSFLLFQVREMIAGGHPWFRELSSPMWSFLELPTGHWPMFSTSNCWALLAISQRVPVTGLSKCAAHETLGRSIRTDPCSGTTRQVSTTGSQGVELGIATQ